MKKIIFVFLLFIVTISLYSQKIPHPKNSMLYTEFTAYKSALYLKKPIVSSGYIAMNGLDKFIFKQTKPIVIEVKKRENRMFFKREGMNEIEISGNNDNSDNIAFLFSTNEDDLKKNFKIEQITTNGKQKYTVTPFKPTKVEKIEVIGIDDKIENIKIFFKDKSTILYEFKNTITGTSPNEKYF
ncbi:MAG: hypothetical protein A2Y34_04165 [Spirochaetes bacterium GWC1_27_15]|nr:MAG: hypothetical protein A2Y34_04165 [Spirochaetes bacterium GWC1_27_15]